MVAHSKYTIMCMQAYYLYTHHIEVEYQFQGTAQSQVKVLAHLKVSVANIAHSKQASKN